MKVREKLTFSMVKRACLFFVDESVPVPVSFPEPSALRGMSIVFRGAAIEDTVSFPSVPSNSLGLYERAVNSGSGRGPGEGVWSGEPSSGSYEADLLGVLGSLEWSCFRFM